MSPLPMQVKCAACGAPIEGASVWDRGQVLHPWCYATQERAKDHPALQYIAPGSRGRCPSERLTMPTPTHRTDSRGVVRVFQSAPYLASVLRAGRDAQSRRDTVTQWHS